MFGSLVILFNSFKRIVKQCQNMEAEMTMLSESTAVQQVHPGETFWSHCPVCRTSTKHIWDPYQLHPVICLVCQPEAEQAIPKDTRSGS